MRYQSYGATSKPHRALSVRYLTFITIPAMLRLGEKIVDGVGGSAVMENAVVEMRPRRAPC